jgi:hypothetical protein
MMDRLPARRAVEPEVVEPEIVGFEQRPSLWKRIAGRMGLSLFVGALGLGLCAFGAVLTLTVVGAAIGIPLVLFGLGLILLAALLLFGGGPMRTITFRVGR